jgi:IclR family mhp operon transcriptional activator
MVKRIESLGRGLRVLDVLEKSGPMGLAQLSAEMGLAKATLLRILATLEAAGFARRRLADRLWQANLRVRGEPDVQGSAIAEVAGQVLDALCQRVLWPSDVGIYRDAAIRVLETSRRLSPFLVNRDVISRRIHVMPSAMGRAILAWSAPDVRAQLLAEIAAGNDPQEQTARDPRTVERLVAETRDRGYAVRHPGYYVSAPREAQITALAVPVINAGCPVAAINLCWVGSAMSEAEFATRHLARLREAADEIAGKL